MAVMTVLDLADQLCTWLHTVQRAPRRIHDSSALRYAALRAASTCESGSGLVRIGRSSPC